MPSTRSMVDATVNSGTICASPPIETVMSVSTPIRIRFFSISP